MEIYNHTLADTSVRFVMRAVAPTTTAYGVTSVLGTAVPAGPPSGGVATQFGSKQLIGKCTTGTIGNTHPGRETWRPPV